MKTKEIIQRKFSPNIWHRIKHSINTKLIKRGYNQPELGESLVPGAGQRPNPSG